MSSSSSWRRPIVGVALGTSAPITSGVRGLVRANRQAKTTLYFFATRAVNFDRRVIRGKRFSASKKRWEVEEFPFPDVLYVRGGSGKSVNAMAEAFDNMGIPRINPITAFDKSDLYYRLRADKNVSRYLPYTRDIDLDDISRLGDVLRQRKSVYIKACRGRRGLQVVRVTRISSGRYEYSYSILGRLTRRKVRGLTSLQRVLKEFFGDRKVIVQQAIDLLRVNGTRPVDFRAELQRNKFGELEIVAIPIRVGRSNSPITTHGSAYQLVGFLKKLLPRYSRQQLRNTRNEIYKFVETVYRSVERVYGKFGEIGIDFALDKKGRIWLIECNAQSAKVSIRRSYNQRALRIYRNPLEYAKILARSGANRR